MLLFKSPIWDFIGGSSGKEHTYQSSRHKRHGFNPWLAREVPVQKGMATLSGILAQEIPRTEETGRLQSQGSQRVRHDWSNLAHTHAFKINTEFTVFHMLPYGNLLLKFFHSFKQH